jgi:histidinol phosphatase-like PHP family hydrolase
MLAGDDRICDLHTHTSFSDGRMTPEEVWEAARSRGYGVGISDHCGRGDFQLESNRRFDDYLLGLEGLPVFRSAELDLGNPGEVTPDRLARCHYLIGGLHSLAVGAEGGRLDFFDPEADPGDPDALIHMMLNGIGRGVREHRFHILAHPGLLPRGLRGRADSILGEVWEKGLIGLALEHGFALEISSRWELPGRGLIEKARRAGVRFTLGSDGHGRETMCRLDYSLRMVEACGIGPGQLFRPEKQRTREEALIMTTGPTVSSR